MDTQDNFGETLITLTADIVSAHVSNNSVAVNDLPPVISSGASASAIEPQQDVEADCSATVRAAAA